MRVMTSVVCDVFLLRPPLSVFSCFPVEQALELLSRMIDLRMRPTTHCFNAVIRALTESDQLQEVS